jgi:hypothetical protein
LQLNLDLLIEMHQNSQLKTSTSVGFNFSREALTEIDAFFRREHTVMIPLTVREILDEQIVQKLA